MTSRYKLTLRDLGFMLSLQESPIVKRIDGTAAGSMQFYWAHKRTIAFDEFGKRWFALYYIDLTTFGFIDKTKEVRDVMSTIIDSLPLLTD